MKHIKTSIIFLISIITIGICQAQSVDEIINNYFTKTGGIDNWRSMQTLTMKTEMSMQGMELTGMIYSKRPNKQKSVIEVMGQTVVQAYDGKDAWMINPYMGDTSAQIVPEEMAKSMKQNNFESEFLDYAAKGNTVELIGSDTVKGKNVFQIKLTKKNGNIEYHYFDKDSYMLVMTKGIISSGQQKGMEANVYFSDFRPVGKLTFPFHMESEAGGQMLQTINFTDITINDPIDDSIFAFPGNK